MVEEKMEIDSNKVRSFVNQDRLSALPDELIHQILSCFDTKFAVQTSMLSSRWKLIWKSMPCLDFSSSQFNTLHKFSKFVTHVLSHRNHQVEVASVKLYFYGAASQVFVRKIANYAISHNVQELTVKSWPKKNHEFPPCLFSSQTLKQLSLSFNPYAPRVTPKTPWNFPALTNLHLFEAKLCDDISESVDLFSMCLNLKNLAIESCIIRAKVFDIITPRISTLKLINCKHYGVINVIAPQVENLTVIRCPINNFKAPLRLSYFCYRGYHPKWFKNCFHSLNEVSVSLSIYERNQPYKETAARETINMLQELCSARCLTLNIDIVECISSFPDLLSHLPSPFSNLISLNIISYMRNDAYKVKLPTEARNFLLEDSPSATFIMDLPEPPPTKAMKAKEAREKKAKQLADVQIHMNELQTSLKQGDILFSERKLVQEKKKTTVVHLMTELQLWADKKLMQSEPDSTQIEAVVAGLEAQIVACLGEILDMVSQEIDEAFTFSSKRAHIRSLLEALPKRQMTAMEARYTHQFEETETLCNRLHSTRRDLFHYAKENIEALKRFSSDKFAAIQDFSGSKLSLSSQPSSSSAVPPPTKAMEVYMNCSRVGDIESHMKELQASVELENINLVERKQVREETQVNLNDRVAELLVSVLLMHSELKKIQSDEVEARISQIKIHFREMHDLAEQYNEAAGPISEKKTHIELLLKKLPNLWSKEMSACFAHQLKEADALGVHLYSEFSVSKFIDAHFEKFVSGLFKKFSSSKLPLSLQQPSSASEIQQMKKSKGRKLFGDWRKLLGDASTSSAPSQERMYTQSEVDALLAKTDAIYAKAEALLTSQTNALFTSLSNALQAAGIPVPPFNSPTVCE